MAWLYPHHTKRLPEAGRGAVPGPLGNMEGAHQAPWTDLRRVPGPPPPASPADMQTPGACLGFSRGLCSRS